MLLPPILERELRLRTAKRRIWWVRSGVAAAALSAWLPAVLLHRVPLQDGRAMLALVALFPWVIATFSGILTTADSISREKREGTLPLLVMTELHPLEIVLQKLLAANTNLFLMLLALSPICGLAVVMGGVTFWQVLAVTVLVLPIAFFSGCVGCLVSSVVWRPVTAALVTFLILTGSCAASYVVERLTSNALLAGMLQAANPAVLYLKVVAGEIGAWDVFAGILSFGGAGLACLAGAAHAIPRMIFVRNRAWLPRLRFLPNFGTIVFFGAISLPWFLPRGTAFLPFSIFFVNTAVKLIVAVEAVRLLHQRRWLELVLTTPIEADAYLAGQFRELGKKIALPLGLTLLVNIILAGRNWNGGLDFAIFAGFLLISDCAALACAGVAAGLTFSKLNEALGWSLARVLLLPLMLACVGVLAGVRTETITGALVLYALLSIGVGGLNAVASAWLLRNQFRSLASR